MKGNHAIGIKAMETVDFTDNKAGRLIKTVDEAWAFVPDPLPPKLDLNWEMVNALEKAQQALGELAGT